MEELTKWDIEFLERMVGNYKNSGLVVKTQKGLTGRTKHTDNPVNGKIPVYLDNGGKILCDPKKLTLIGYID